MTNDPRITPANNPVRERLVRLANDTAWGERLARWIGRSAGVLQLRLKLKHQGDIPWTPLKCSLNEATVALVTTGGVHLCADRRFDLKSDATFRAIPRTAMQEDLCITHERYDRRDAARDINLVFPLQRLLELEAKGVIGRVADVQYGLGFTDDPLDLLPTGREVGKLLAREHVDLALLVPA